jgi:hypothetical protein
MTSDMLANMAKAWVQSTLGPIVKSATDRAIPLDVIGHALIAFGIGIAKHAGVKREAIDQTVELAWTTREI